jgi:ABC-2 type transport system permease protein
MRKILIVAQTEFSTLVRSKAFIAGVLLLPVMMGLSFGLTRATRKVTDNKDRTFAIVDYTGVVGAPLAAVARLFDPGSQLGDTRPGGAASSRFIPVQIETAGRQPDDLRLELSDRVRKGELFAFIEVPENVIDPAAEARILYYSDHPSYTTLPTWLRVAANGVIISERFKRASIDRALVARLSKQATVDNLDLVERAADGRIKPAVKVDTARAIGVPIAIMALMFITIMSSGPALLNSVIVEKMSRISEVLMGSVTPFQLMLGKLLGSVSVSVLLATIYVAGGLVTAHYWGSYASAVTVGLLAWFLVFLVLSILMFGAVFIAVGAACTDLKDSQGMMTPVMMLLMVPMFLWYPVLRAPDGTMSTVLSLFPTAAPFLMMLRISLAPGPPLWQIAIAAALMAATTVLTIWAAAKIFRTGLLMQGKTASLGEMMRWVRAD